MSLKSRFLRIALTALVILGFTGYFAFATLFFSPLEGDYDFDLSGLIPRDVDFYVSKAGLRRDFGAFPEPVFLDQLEADARGKVLLALPEVREFLERLALEETRARIDEALASLPVKVEPLKVYGGRDLALAGFFRGANPADADWALYGRSNWLGKLAVALLDHPEFLKLEAQGLAVQTEGKLATVSGGELARPLHVTRVLDVVVVGTSKDLVARVHDLEASRGENSFGQSAKYGDSVGLVEREGDELEVYVDYNAFAESRGLPGRFPDPESPELGEALAGRFFQVGAVRELIGMISFGSGVAVRLNGLLSAETMTPVQRRFSRTRGFDRTQVIGPQQIATLVPADVGLFAFLQIDLGDVLREALTAAEPALIENLEDVVRSAWGYADLHPLIDDVVGSCKDRVAVLVRRNDYPDDPDADGDGQPDGPPHNDIPVYAWAVVLWLTEKEQAAFTDDTVIGKIEETIRTIVENQSSFGIQGREPGSIGVFTNKVKGGHVVYEYWSQLIDGTGHVATLQMNEFFLISNHHKLLGDLVQTYYQGAPSYPRLAEETWFQTQVNAGLPSANALLWLDPRAVSATRRALAAERAERGVAIDWEVERPRIEKKILKERFPGETWGALSPGVEEQLGMIYDEEASEFERTFRSQHEPAMRARLEQEIEASEILRGALLELSISQSDFDLFGRLITPFE